MEITFGFFSQQEWNDILSSFLDQSIVQTWEYGETKARVNGWETVRAVIRQKGELIGAFQCMIRYIPGIKRGVVWINRGPLWRKFSEENLGTLISMLTEIRRYWVVERNMYLLIAPPVDDQALDAHYLKENGFCKENEVGCWASGLLDLSMPAEVIRSKLHQKWRNCLNKAEKLEIHCESGTGEQVFHEILEEYDKMTREKNLTKSVSTIFLTQWQAFLGEDRKLWGLLGRQNGVRLGGILLARYGKTCEYLIGAFNEQGRAVNAGNFLLWQAIIQMKLQGYRWFDLGGMHPEKTPKGIYHFKNGLGALPYCLVGAFTAYRDNLINRGLGWAVRLSIGN